jgi:hypothetical protein
VAPERSIHRADAHHLTAWRMSAWSSPEGRGLLGVHSIAAWRRWMTRLQADQTRALEAWTSARAGASRLSPAASRLCADYFQQKGEVVEVGFGDRMLLI